MDENEKVKDIEKKEDRDTRCCYVVDACGCYVDPRCC